MKAKNLILLLAITICSINCKKIDKKAHTKTQTDVKLYALNGGDILVNKLEVFSQDTTYTGRQKLLVDPYFVITHPKGNLIWDAGLPESFVLDKPVTEPTGVFTLQRPDSLVNQLKSINLSIEDFQYIALSHCHFDHIGHANYFKNATWLVQESEYNFITSDSEKSKNIDTYNSIKDLTHIKKLHGDFDVFGDGKVIIKLMPGHTIGHQVLCIDVGLKKPILLTGDLYHFRENRTHKRVPSFNYSVEETLKSMHAFEEFAKQNNAEIIIQHSKKDFEKLQALLKE